MDRAPLHFKPKLKKIQKTVRVPEVKAEALERLGGGKLSFSDMVNQLIDAYLESKLSSTENTQH